MNSGTLSTPLEMICLLYAYRIEEKEVIGCVLGDRLGPTTVLYFLIPLIAGLRLFPNADAITGVRISCFGIRANLKPTASIIVYTVFTERFMKNELGNRGIITSRTGGFQFSVLWRKRNALGTTYPWNLGKGNGCGHRNRGIIL